MRRLLADAGLEISTGKMSSWWTGNPPTLRLEELDVLCAVLDCAPNDLMTPEPGKVAARRPAGSEAAHQDGSGPSPVVTPRLNRTRPAPPL
jgi:DNA-binding Xre family transcriptional regulator